MPRKTIHVPQYLHHKQSNTARVRIAGVEYSLGKYGCPASYAKYERLIAEWRSMGCPTAPMPAEMLVSELILMYWQWLEPQYEQSVLWRHKVAIAVLRQMYGDCPVSDFGPRALKAVRESMIDKGWKRSTINERVTALKRMFKWAVQEELIDPSIWHGLQAVSGLRAGRTEAPESEPVRPVPAAHIEATLAVLSPTVADMVRVQLLTGMRPGELCAMTTGEIDTSGDVWFYEPREHKTAHHGKRRVIAIGPEAQAILERRLRPELDKPIFSPADAVEEVATIKRANRKSYLSCNKGRDAARRANRDKRKRPPSDRYDSNAYRHAIQRAARRAGVPEWSPNQLRHTRATEIRKQYGLDAAGAVLGHSKIETTQVYAERDLALAVKVARESG